MLLKQQTNLFENILRFQKINVCVSILKVNGREQCLKHTSEDKMGQLIPCAIIPSSYCAIHLILVVW